MSITGERTVPGIWHENYWFRRHEVVYRHILPVVDGLDVLEAGCGEGYGAQILATRARSVCALDYDAYAIGHAHAVYPHIAVVRGNLVQLPYAEESFDVVVSLQTIEHLWDQPRFIAECLRVLRPHGRMVVSTPNTLTFPPGNMYHPKELTARELRDLVTPYATITSFLGVHHRASLAAWEAANGSIVDQQIASAYGVWTPTLADTVASISVDDFALFEGDIDTSLDLVVIAAKDTTAVE